MKMGRLHIGIIGSLLLLAACSKELSFEQGADLPTNTSDGTLSGAGGACANINVLGAYGQGLALDTAQNKLEVEVNFTQAGSWYIFTDTVNGVYFNGTGTVTATGLTTVTLRGYGVPANPGPFTWNVKYKASTCSASITVSQVATPGTGDYFPMTANSWWTYIFTDPSATPADTLYQLSTGKSATQTGGGTFNLFTIEDPTFKDSSWYRKSGNDYNQIGDLDFAGATDNPIIGEWTFLKDNVPAGTSWISTEGTGSISGATVKVRIKFDLLEKDVNVVVGNRVFANTIKVKVTQQAQLTGATSWADVLTYETWFAKGIGLINLAAAAPVYGFRVLKYSVN
jgi:hypothetical protein